MAKPSCAILVAAFLTSANAVAQSENDLWRRDSVRLLAELGAMVRADQVARSGGAKSPEAWKAMEQADAARTRRMIEVIRTYGFPSMRRFKSRPGEFLAPYIILVHSPKEYTDTLRPLLKAEKAAGRISEDEYAHIEWHLNGRVGKPDFK